MEELVYGTEAYNSIPRGGSLDEWEERELYAYRVISRYWGSGLTMRQRALLYRLVSFTFGCRRDTWTVPLASLLAGPDEHGEIEAGPVGISTPDARRALKRLRKLGLITMTRQGRATRFFVNADAIIKGGQARASGSILGDLGAMLGAERDEMMPPDPPKERRRAR